MSEKDVNVALVTGGTRGIGRAIVEKLAGLGISVAFTYISSSETAEKLAAELREKGVDALPIQSDASSYTSAEEAVTRVIETFGRIDVLVNNAGVTRDNLLLRMSEEDWDTVIATNLKGVFNFCKAAYRPMMRQRSGKIINVSSVVGTIGNAGQSNYAASKAGIIGFSKSLARELAARGVQVNVVAPGYIETDMTAAMPDAARDAMLESIPMKRTGTPSDIANAVAFLSSSESDYITGHVLHVNGGLFM
jgi:3-oxoacyl-[acyl-carrier protein] reductase